MELVNSIFEIVDRCFNIQIEEGLNTIDTPPLPAMSTQVPCPYEYLWYWVPTESTVTEAELNSLEKAIGYQLPSDYKAFLRYKHFYGLYLGHATFFKHLPGSWLTELFAQWYQGYSAKYLIEKGFIPFANWEDWGMLCFNTSQGTEGNYPVVVWDNDSPENLREFSSSFYSAILHMDADINFGNAC